MSEDVIREVWRQAEKPGGIPVVFKRGPDKRIMLRLPSNSDPMAYHDWMGNRDWLHGANTRHPLWNPGKRCWEVPRTWFDMIVFACLARYGKSYIIHGYREKETCAPACWNARGFDCNCSCMGEHHGMGNPAERWYVVSETCAVHWGPRKYSCRLLESKFGPQSWLSREHLLFERGYARACSKIILDAIQQRLQTRSGTDA